MFHLKKSSLETLWHSAPIVYAHFPPLQLSSLPENAKRYLKHAISPNTRLANAVRLKMHGEIKLKGWQPFQAEQIICYHKGMIWQAILWMNGLPVYGWDHVIEGKGAVQWKLLGLLPVVQASGPDTTRSAVGRMQGEYVWLPSALLNSAGSLPLQKKRNTILDLLI